MDSLTKLEEKVAAFADRHDLGGIGQDVADLAAAVVAVAHDLDDAIAELRKPAPVEPVEPATPPASEQGTQ